MKQLFSVVIVCKNAAGVIMPVLESIKNSTDDVVIYDNGSTDNTVLLVQQYPNVQLHQGAWEGFGKTKQKATQLAKYDWILSLDADEALDATLQQQLAALTLDNAKVVYDIAYKNFLGDTYVKWGEWGFDHHIRLFNRQVVQWNDAPVHEALVMPKDIIKKKLKGYILHHTIKDTVEYSQKVVRYALLNAEKYHARGKKATFLKRYAGPVFAFVKFYFFMLGFLDGWAGLVCARMTAFYTFLKYARLYELQRKK
jgi:glycosyltransferase involved in cell wall biosynthesis